MSTRYPATEGSWPQPRQPDPVLPPSPPSPPIASRPSRWQYVVLVVLVLMAVADAFGFYLTLQLILRNYSDYVLPFACALTLGAVTAAHEIGRIARSRREGREGSVAWVMTLSAFWLGLGLVIAWIRVGQPISTNLDLSGPLTGTGPSGIDQQAVEVAALLLVFYLLTGALAMTHGFQHGDPRSADHRDALRRRADLLSEISEEAHRHGLAQARRNEGERQIARDDAAHEQHLQAMAAAGAQIREEVRLEQMIHHRDPATTDGLGNPGQG